MKIITLCGSFKYKEKILEIAELLTLGGNCVLQPIYPTNKNLTEKDINHKRVAHFERIAISDAIMVVNVDNYIGKDTQLEIAYANGLGKEILYYRR